MDEEKENQNEDNTSGDDFLEGSDSQYEEDLNDDENERSEDEEDVSGDESDDEDESEDDDEISDEEKDEDSQDVSSASSGPRFDLIEIIFYMGLSIISDILDGRWVTRFVFAPVIIAWLFIKGVNSVGKNVIAQAVELIPGIDWLPITTVAAILTIWSTNSPESFNKTFGIASKAMNSKKIAR